MRLPCARVAETVLHSKHSRETNNQVKQPKTSYVPDEESDIIITFEEQILISERSLKKDSCNSSREKAKDLVKED
ncbi:UNVERIFIED_CONTAM: hypothetical protein NCL1_32551 [Trichonephila clavipes]